MKKGEHKGLGGNIARTRRKYGSDPSRRLGRAKAGKRSTFIKPPRRNDEKALRRAAGNQQFWNDKVPTFVKIGNAGGLVVTVPIHGVWDADRKHWIRREREEVAA